MTVTEKIITDLPISDTDRLNEDDEDDEGSFEKLPAQRKR
jgi:hypothetical protein